MNTQNLEEKIAEMKDLVKRMLDAIKISDIPSDMEERLKLRLNELRTNDVMTKEQENKILKAAILRKQEIYEERRLGCIKTLNRMEKLEEIKKLFSRVLNEDAKARELLRPSQSCLKITIPDYLDKKNMDLFRTEVNMRIKNLQGSEIV